MSRQAAVAARPDAGAPWVGRSLLRVEDRPLLTGGGRFVDDLNRPGQLVARVVRSHIPHGRIRAIDATAAEALDGVVAVVTACDVPDVRIPVRMMPSEEAVPVTQPPLAREVVRYVGEPVAVVVATDAYRAEDAADAIVVDIAPLEPLLDAHAAVAADAPSLHAGAPTGNMINRLTGRHGTAVDDLLASADIVVSERLHVHRHAAIPLETRGLVAEQDAQGRLTVWGPTKVKHFNRAILSALLDLPEDAIRFVEPDVGGGFGARGEFYPEDFLVPLLAIRLGRPVKWVEDRREHFVATNHSREVWCDIDMAAAADGTLLGFRASCLVDQGAYARTHGTMLLPWVLVYHLAGPYAWDGFEIEASSVLTNKTPSGTYRGPSQYESAFFRERMVDRVALVVGIDPLELRARNVVPVEAMPYTLDLGNGGMPLVYDGGDFPQVLDELARRAGYAALRREQRRRRAAGELVGVGVSAHVEAAAFGRYEYARIVPAGSGRFTVYTGVASLGQGVRTILAQIAADQLRVSADRVTIVHHDTDLVPQGLGAYASRATVIGGGAVIGAADDLRRKAIAAAADRLEISERDLELVDGGVVRPRGQPSGGIAIDELGCEGACRYDKPLPAFDMGAMLALVAVDHGTGAPSVERFVICHDVGQSVNPLLVDGQLVGAAVQGIGGTLLEELSYDAGGQPLSTSFMDYLMPTAADVPAVDAVALDLPHHDVDTEHPLGVKGVGESGIVGAGAAIANAVADAVGRDAGVGRLPLAPAVVASLIDGG